MACHGLSKQEARVVRLVCQRLSKPEIAAALGIKLGTLRAHMGRIYRKWGVYGEADMILHIARDPEKYAAFIEQNTESEATP